MDNHYFQIWPWSLVALHWIHYVTSLCVWASMCVCFLAHLFRLCYSQDKSLLFYKNVPAGMFLLSVHKACNNNLGAKPAWLYRNEGMSRLKRLIFLFSCRLYAVIVFVNSHWLEPCMDLYALRIFIRSIWIKCTLDMSRSESIPLLLPKKCTLCCVVMLVRAAESEHVVQLFVMGLLYRALWTVC